jgi:hypothetical protein
MDTIMTLERFMSTSNGERWWTTGELAKASGWSKQAILGWIKDGKIAAVPETPSEQAAWLISDAEAQRFIATYYKRRRLSK